MALRFVPLGQPLMRDRHPATKSNPISAPATPAGEQQVGELGVRRRQVVAGARPGRSGCRLGMRKCARTRASFPGPPPEDGCRGGVRRERRRRWRRTRNPQCLSAKPAGRRQAAIGTERNRTATPEPRREKAHRGETEPEPGKARLHDHVALGALEDERPDVCVGQSHVAGGVARSPLTGLSGGT